MTTIHPTPSGTRDVLPDEMREMHAVVESMRAVFGAHGYGEVHTPALEYEQVLTRGDPAAADPAYKLFDEQGNVLVLRSDMTIPIARVVSTRYASADPPLRFCYVAHAYRSVRPQRGQDREMLQAGIELVGRARSRRHGRDADRALRGARRGRPRGLPRRARRRLALPGAARRARRAGRGARGDPARAPDARLRRARARRSRSLRLGDEATAALLGVPQRRGGAEVLDAAGPAADGLRGVYAALPAAVADRVIFDLGLARSLAYYTGAVYEVYDAALGAPLGGGGRYDDLLGRFGRDLPAAGWALNVERLHIALVGERRGEQL